MADNPNFPQYEGGVTDWSRRLVAELDRFGAQVAQESQQAPFIPGFLSTALPDAAKYASTALRNEHSRTIFAYDTGELLYSDGTQWVALPDGTGGQVNTVVPGPGVYVDATDPAAPIAAAMPYRNMAELEAATNLTIGDRVATAGWASPGDGGDNQIEVVEDATGTLSEGYVDLPGSSLQGKLLFPSGEVHAKQFGVLADDSTDDLDALQAAVNYIVGQGGGKLHLPVGRIAISDTLVVACSAMEVVGGGAAGTFFNNDTGQPRGTLIRYTGDGSSPAISAGNGTNLYTGMLFQDFGVDCKGASGSIALRLNNGVINSEFNNLNLYNTAKGVEILGTGLITSFNNKFINCTLEHFDDFGIDVLEDGNGTIIQGCKFINSAALGAAPRACVRVGADELCNSIVIKDCSFGAQNIVHHIEIVECQALTIDSCEIEASGNSTITASSLVKLGANASGKVVAGFQISGCRFLANSTANNAIRFDDVVGGIIDGNVFIDTFLAGAYISNANAAEVALLGNDYGGGTPISSISGLQIFFAPGGQVTFGNGVVLNSGPVYNVTNVSTDRAYDADTVTLAELADVVGTLITDLQGSSLIN